MATSARFDAWDDVGMQFTDEQLSACDPSLTAAARANLLIDLIPAVQRRSALGTLPVWWTEVGRRMTVCATYYLWRIDHPRLDVGMLNAVAESAHGSDLRELTLRAHRLGSNEQEFVDAWKAELFGTLRQHVTLGRRCVASRAVSGWKKSNTSMSNKVAYALVKEIDALEQIEISLHKYQIGSGNREEGTSAE
jgi:hypothetical protein